MKALITGGYGFIGSHVAERLKKEGHDIYIIDNLSTGTKKNIDFKHRSYVFNTEDKKCEEIFKNNKFDCVIHFAVSVNAAVENPLLDTGSNVLGLINMLNLSSKYNVKKFIFASSAVLYGNNLNLPLQEDYESNPESPDGMSKFLAEFFCRKWSELYGLQVIVFRLSNVYGPRQSAEGQGGVIATFIGKALNDRDLIVYGDGNQTRDFIYVEDVADAVHRATYCHVEGIVNLSSNTESSINVVLEKIREKLLVSNVVYSDKRIHDIERSRLDNTRVKRSLDWVPMYSLEEGLEKTIKWYLTNNNFENEIAAASEPYKETVFAKFLPYIENLLGFFIVLTLHNLMQSNTRYGTFDLMIVYIIMMGIMWGNKQSAIAVVLSGMFYFRESMKMGMDLVSLLYDPSTLLQISIYILVGVSIGYTVDRKNREIEFNNMKLEDMEEKYSFVNDLYNETRAIKDELHKQIAGSRDSFGQVYNIIRELDSLQSKDVFNASIGVLENIMQSNQIAIYIISKNSFFLRLIAKSKKMDNDVAKSIRIEDNPEIKIMIESKVIFVNKNINPKLPILMAPVVDNDKVVAIVAIQKIKFENMTLYYQNLFKVVISLISASINKAYRYEEATYDETHIHGTPILTSDSFGNLLQKSREAKDNHLFEYSLLAVESLDVKNEAAVYSITGMLREVDSIGIGPDNRVWILLSNTSESDASIVVNRLENIGVNVSIINEE